MDRDYSDLALPERSADIDIVLNRLEICKEPIDERHAVRSIVQSIDRESREGAILITHFNDKFLQNLALSRPDLTSMLWHFGHDARDWLRDMPDIRVDPHRVPAKNNYSLFGYIMIAKHLTFAPGYDDAETLSIIRSQHNKYFVLIGDDSIEWYLQFKGLYPYSPGGSLPDETTDLDPAALEACLGLWVTYFRKHGGNRSDMARLLEMLTAYQREHPATPGQIRGLAKMRENFAKSNTLQEPRRAGADIRLTIEPIETSSSLEDNLPPSLPPPPSRSKEQVTISPQSTLPELNRLIELDPTLIPPYLERAKIYKDQGLYDKAMADYKHILMREPDHETALFNCGKIHLDTGNYAQAIKDYDALIKTNDTMAEAFHNRGLARQRRGEFQSARQDFTRAIELEPNYTAAYQNRGIVCSELGNYDTAISNFDKAVELEGTNAKIYYDRALTHSNHYHYEAALADYLRAIEIEPTLDRPYYNVGIVLIKLNRLDDALPYLRKALRRGDSKAGPVIKALEQFGHEAEKTSFVVNLANSKEELKVLCKDHPLMADPNFIRSLQRAMEQYPSANTPTAQERLAWLKQLSDSQLLEPGPSISNEEQLNEEYEQKLAIATLGQYIILLVFVGETLGFGIDWFWRIHIIAKIGVIIVAYLIGVMIVGALLTDVRKFISSLFRLDENEIPLDTPNGCAKIFVVLFSLVGAVIGYIFMRNLVIPRLPITFQQNILVFAFIGIGVILEAWLLGRWANLLFLPDPPPSSVDK